MSYPTLERFRNIVIEGPIGVGKTSLTHKLAQYLNAQIMLENEQHNPFLESFYEKPNSGYSLSTQLYFLMQRFEQITNATLIEKSQYAQRRYVSDYLFEKTDVFSWLTLTPEEVTLYQKIRNLLNIEDMPQPDLVIWLQAEPVNLHARIRKRGIAAEKRIDLHYLSQLCEAYARFFQFYNKVPVFSINTDNFDLLNDDSHFFTLIERLENFRGNREFFNPQI